MSSPFDPIPPSAPQTDTTPCPKCGNPMDPSTAAYDEVGRMVCRSCAAHQTVAAANRTIEEKDPGSTRNLWLASAGSAVTGLASCCVAGRILFVVVPVMGIISGGYVIAHLLRDTKGTQAQLGGAWWAVLGLSIVGVLFGLLGIGLTLLAMVGAGMVDRYGY